MNESKFIVDFMEQYYTEIPPKEFYRSIFPKGELESSGVHEEGKYNAVAVELLPKGSRGNAKRYLITDELAYIDKLLEKENFIIISPVSYAGRTRESKNARYLYAMAIDLDGVDSLQKITDLFFQMGNDVLPTPTFTVTSGTGLHLYYVFEEPVPCFKNITKQMHELKQALTKKIWNRYTTSLWNKPQLQSLFQGFRLVGGVTKTGSRTKAYITGKPVSVEYLNEFVENEYRVEEFTYKSELTLKKAKEKYPEWYDKRIVNKQPKGTWQCKHDLYDWWLEKLKTGATVGHRYYCVMCLAIYAKKSGVDREELEKDAFGLVESMEQLTTDEGNHFTRQDVLAALEMYNDNYFTFPIDSIVELSAIPIEKNKRNGRKQSTHLKIARATLDIMNDDKGITLQGRKNKEYEVGRWQFVNKNGTQAQCSRETGLSRQTVAKYWRECEKKNEKQIIIEKWQQMHTNGTKAECIKETGISKPTVYKYWKSTDKRGVEA